MDFSGVDLLPILKSSMPCRFADMPASDFELFVAQFFKDNGFVVEQVKHRADYGIDVIVSKDQSELRFRSSAMPKPIQSGSRILIKRLAAKASTVAIMLYSSLRPTLQLQRGRWRKKQALSSGIGASSRSVSPRFI